MSAARLQECVQRWPECESGAYDPRCCRFPKSCSCTSGVGEREGQQEWAIYLGDKIVTVYDDEEAAADALAWHDYDGRHGDVAGITGGIAPSDADGVDRTSPLPTSDSSREGDAAEVGRSDLRAQREDRGAADHRVACVPPGVPSEAHGLARSAAYPQELTP